MFMLPDAKWKAAFTVQPSFRLPKQSIAASGIHFVCLNPSTNSPSKYQLNPKNSILSSHLSVEPGSAGVNNSRFNAPPSQELSIAILTAFAGAGPGPSAQSKRNLGRYVKSIDVSRTSSYFVKTKSSPNLNVPRASTLCLTNAVSVLDAVVVANT